ncbi:MAG: hypothetical protein WAK55_12055 [Xanthobacteraceae bacterium]
MLRYLRNRARLRSVMFRFWGLKQKTTAGRSSAISISRKWSAAKLLTVPGQ